MNENIEWQKAQDEYLSEFADPICLKCQYYVYANKCLAYPTDGIPMSYMSGRIEHHEVVKDQTGLFVFQARRSKDG